MGFFTAFFGGIFYGGSLLKRSIDRDRREAYQNAIRSQTNYLFSKTNGARERQIRSMVWSGEHTEEIYDTLHDDLVWVYGDEDSYRRCFPIPGTPEFEFTEYTRDFNNTAYWATNLLLAKEGIIPLSLATSGFELGPAGLRLYLLNKICQRIEELLIKNGVKIELYMVSDDYNNPLNSNNGKVEPKTASTPSTAIRWW